MMRVRGVQGERGASTYEYVALIAVVAAVSGAFAVLAGPIIESVRFSICRAFGGDCPSSTNPHIGQRDPNFTKCTIFDQNRTLGFNASYRGIRGENSGKDQLIEQVDPVTGKKTAAVILTGKSGLGVESGDRDDVPILDDINKRLKRRQRGKFDVSVFAGINGELGSRYDFDDVEQAERFLNGRRGADWKRVVSGLSGTTGNAVENGLATLNKYVRKGWAWLTGGDPAKVADEQGLAPNAMIIRLGGEAKGSAKWSGTLGADNKVQGKASGEAGLNGALSGDLTVFTEGPNRGMRIYTNKGTLDDNLKVDGGLDLSNILPAAAKVQLQGAKGRTVTYTVVFDKEGNPLRVQFQLDTEVKGGGGVKVGVPQGKQNDPAKTGEVKGDGNVGRRYSHIYNLELSGPENKENLDAFEGLFATPGGLVAVPRSFSYGDPKYIEQLVKFRTAMDKNGQEVKFEYDTFGATLGSEGASGEKGIKKKGFGIGWTDETTRARYRSGHYFDRRHPDLGWVPLANCR